MLSIQGGNTLDIVGIPSEVKGETLEESVVGIFDKLGCSIYADRTEAGHRASKNNKTVTVAFIRRKDYQKDWNKKRSQRTTKWGTLVYLDKAKYLSTVAYVLVMKCYGQKVRNYLL